MPSSMTQFTRGGAPVSFVSRARSSEIPKVRRARSVHAQLWRRKDPGSAFTCLQAVDVSRDQSRSGRSEGLPQELQARARRGTPEEPQALCLRCFRKGQCEQFPPFCGCRTFVITVLRWVIPCNRTSQAFLEDWQSQRYAEFGLYDEQGLYNSAHAGKSQKGQLARRPSRRR